MTDWTSQMTKLQAINICLNSVGTSSVEDVDAGGLDAQMASDLLDETCYYVQAEGWAWNRETFRMSPDADGFINLPANVSNVEVATLSNDLDVAQRGLKLYDRANNTYVFKQGMTVYLDTIINLAWDDLPTPMRIFITATAAMTLQERILGNDVLDKDLAKRAQDAWVKLVRADNRDTKPNMLHDNFSSASVSNRGFFNRGAYL